MKAAELLVCVLAGSTAAVLVNAQTVPERTNPGIERIHTNAWVQTALAHVPGVLNEQDRAIAEWPESRLLAVLRELNRRHATEELNDALLKGALLHADISFILGATTGEPRVRWASGKQGLLALDGQAIGSAGLDGQVFFVRRLVSAMRPPDSQDASESDEARDRRIRDWEEHRRKDPRVRQIYRAISANFAEQVWLADLDPHLEAARELLPDDTGVLFDDGCLAETLAAPRVQAVVPQEPLSSMDSRPLQHELYRVRLDLNFNLNEAEKNYRRVLQLEPRHVEAAVRLASVLLTRNRPRDAAPLVRDLPEPSDPPLAYYLDLVAAAALERTGHASTARARLESAAARYPTAQSPLLALVRLETARGATLAAARALDRLAALPKDEARRVDPWWAYIKCNGRNVDLEKQHLYEAFRRRGER